MSLSDTDLSITDTDASASRMTAERAACRPFTTSTLEGGVVADAFALLADLRSGLIAAHRGRRQVDASDMAARIDELLARLEAKS